MFLSVSSFPESPSKLAHHSKWQKAPPKDRRGFFGTLLSKRSVPFLKGIRHPSKVHVKETDIPLPRPPNPPPSRIHHRSSLSRSSIRASSIVIDIISVPQNDEYFPASTSETDDVDASSLDPIIELFPSPSISPVALPITPITKRVLGTPTTKPVEAPHHPCAQCPFGDCAHAHQIITLVPAREFDKVAPVVGESRTHDHWSHAPSTSATTESSGQSHAMTSSGATAFPTSPSPAMQSPPAQPKAGILRQRSISTGGKTVTGTVPPHRPRYKSETGVSSRASTNSTHSSSRGTDTGKFPVPPLSSGTGASFIPRLQQGRGTKTRRTLSNASGKSVVASSKSVEPPLPSPPLLSAHMLHMRSGSRPCPTHLLSGRPTSRSNTEPPQLPSRGAASLARNSPPELATYLPRATRRRPVTGDGPSALPRLHSSSSAPAAVVHPSGGDSQLPLPGSREQGWPLRLPTPRAEVFGDVVRRSPAEERYHRRPQTAPEAVLKETPTILVTSEDTAEYSRQP